MLTTETEILAILRNLPQPALEKAKILLDFLAWRYQNTSPKGAKSPVCGEKPQVI